MPRPKPGPYLSMPCHREKRIGNLEKHKRYKSKACRCERHKEEEFHDTR